MRIFCLSLIAFCLSGCATLEEEIRYQTQAQARSRDPAYLSGFSEGCESGYAQSSIVIKAQYKRDESRVRKDKQYATGWDDGRAACNNPGGSATFLFKRREAPASGPQ